MSIATDNMANYNLTDRKIEGAFMTRYPKPEKKKTALRRVIHDLDVDVLALQEIGGSTFLRELQRDLRTEGLNYPYAHVLEAADDMRRVAVLSRMPMGDVIEYKDLEFQYFEGRETVKRGMLEVRFPTAGGEVTVFVVHLKSRWTERRDDPTAKIRRGKEATAARDRVLERFPDPQTARFVIVGDLNDVPTERPFRAFEHRGPLAVSRAVRAADSREETWTHFYRRADEYSRVDYVLVSPGLFNAVQGGRAKIWDTVDVLNASDHRPVRVVLNCKRPRGDLLCGK
ncbi:MAG: endonuclease/exonuclease/phosphatase family protein [Candidatus Synoicihabitans palmerolidicus]|nr:endonuclease/exonuclease/phosphatase family protein [Candidatus Synoicihabitans palmerolidicus]